MRTTFFLFFAAAVTTVSIASCGRRELSYDEQFRLHELNRKQYDLYNPILHRFRLDSVNRRSQFPLEVFLRNDTAAFMLWTDGSYGYLFSFEYDSASRVAGATIFPVLGNRVHEGAEVLHNQWFYSDGVPIVVRDELNDQILTTQGDSVRVFRGVLGKGNRFVTASEVISGYYIRPFSSIISATSRVSE